MKTSFHGGNASCQRLKAAHVLNAHVMVTVYGFGGAIPQQRPRVAFGCTGATR